MTIHVKISGRVQGVYFRASAKQEADGLGLKGWVRNTPGGLVELVASGDEATLQRFLAWCRRGPPRAQVAEVEVKQIEGIEFADFQLRI